IVMEHTLGATVNHGALEAKLGYAALQLLGRGLRVWHGKCGETSETARMPGYCLGQSIVRTSRELDRLGGFELLNWRRNVREDLDIDSGRIHVAQPDLVNVWQAFEHARHWRTPRLAT